MSRTSLKGIYGDGVYSILRLEPDYEVGRITRAGGGVVLLAKMRDGSYEVCESDNPIQLVKDVQGRRNEIDIADTVLGVLFAVLFSYYYIKMN